jgi:hypothetical protein
MKSGMQAFFFLASHGQSLSLSHSQKVQDPEKYSSRIRIPDPQWLLCLCVGLEISLFQRRKSSIKCKINPVTHVYLGYHKRYPLFASCGDDNNITVSHGMVYSDLLQNPLIVPVKKLRHGVNNSVIKMHFSTSFLNSTTLLHSVFRVSI